MVSSSWMSALLDVVRPKYIDRRKTGSLGIKRTAVIGMP